MKTAETAWKFPSGNLSRTPFVGGFIFRGKPPSPFFRPFRDYPRETPPYFEVS
jgi:hypothetical protein